MTNCPAPDWRVAGRGIRLSCGWDWAETKGERKDITIRTAHPCRILTRSPRMYFTANLARRGRCALFLLSNLGFCKQLMEGRPGKTSPRVPSIRPLRPRRGKLLRLPQPSYRDSATSAAASALLAECAGLCRRGRHRREWSIARALRLQYLLQLPAHFFVLHKLPTLGGRQANVDRLDKAGVIFQVRA